VPHFCDGTVSYVFVRVLFAAMARHFRPWPITHFLFSIRADVPPVPEHGITRWRAEIQDF
jgi:hypothetical protein